MCVFDTLTKLVSHLSAAHSNWVWLYVTYVKQHLFPHCLCNVLNCVFIETGVEITVPVLYI